MEAIVRPARSEDMGKDFRNRHQKMIRSELDPDSCITEKLWSYGL